MTAPSIVRRGCARPARDPEQDTEPRQLRDAERVLRAVQRARATGRRTTRIGVDRAERVAAALLAFVSAWRDGTLPTPDETIR